MPDPHQDATAEPAAITGQTTLRQTDQLRFLLAWLPRVLAIMFGLCCIAFVAGWLFGMPARRRAYYLANPWEGLRDVLGDIGWMPVAATAFYALVLFALSWFQFHRVPAASRAVRYEANDEALITRDEAGAALTLPWAMLREVKATGHLLVMKLRTRAWRYLPLRAFSPKDQARLQALIERRLATNANAPRRDQGG
ncbi:YcxB family protein [Phreatobacter sp. AB_2022a]|uniref:YcxB family protein n=1 Tax=Phreatobacter sp. AB_2022a TaxID=3003134 RepID=UPI002287700F|nr:YcxB family protein [Phreatobacter sp. AB_2022a]MCZ0735858.1 YcxB family protein [Phreatobacter sp. AB_2022a]